MFLSVPLLGLAGLIGCEGKSLVNSGPVIRDTPPRLRAENQANQEAAKDAPEHQLVGFTETTEELTGNTVVAEVNGRPIFVDDLIGSIRLTVEADPKLTDEQRQGIMRAQLKQRLNPYIEQEIVLQELDRKVPEENRAMIEESLEKPFQGILNDIMAENKVTNQADLNELMLSQGTSVELLRESFFRMQKVQGFLSNAATAPETIDRVDLVSYYEEHLDEFTSEERVRAQEIIIRFTNEEQKVEARTKMQDVVRGLREGTEFAELAVRYSDALSAEKRGDLGWLKRGSLADKELEAQLFELKTGQSTRIYEKPDSFEIYRVQDHEKERTDPFQEVQKQIERKLKAQYVQEMRLAKLEELKDQAIVTTIFDEPEEE